MATIVLTTNGTLGDHRPLVGLTARLIDRGHQTRLVINPAMMPMAEKQQIPATSNEWESLDADCAMQAAADWNHLQKRPEDPNANTLITDQYRKAIPAMLQASQNAKLIISAPQMYPVAHTVAKHLQIPCVCLILSSLPLEQSAKANEARLLAERADIFSALFADLQMPTPTIDEVRAIWPPQQGLLALSEHFYTAPAHLRNQLTSVGFLHFDDELQSHYRPDASLEKFMAKHEHPLVLTYSSLPVEAPAHVVEVHARAAALLGRPLIIQRGWAGLDIDQLPADVNRQAIHVVDYVPHDWLFAHAAAVIHHGGIGTMASALRQGRPMLIEPYGNDQFGNARQAVLLGVAAAMHPQLLTARGVAQVLATKVLTEQYRITAQTLSSQICAEQPVNTAMNAIESILNATR